MIPAGLTLATDDFTTGELDTLARLAAAPYPVPDVEYQLRPLEWMTDAMGIPVTHIRWSANPEYKTHRWDGTRDPLVMACEALADGKDVGIESATGTGKTYWAALVALWFFACFEDAIVVTTAPKADQLKAQLWKEIGRHWPAFLRRYPHARKVDLRVRLKEGAGEQETWAIIGYGSAVGASEKSATKQQGFHAAHMLIITEETPGMDPAVMTALKNTCTGDHNVRLALGNPDHPRDALHQFCQENGVVAIRISAFDHPNVVCGREIIPGAVGRKSITSKREDYKSDDHPMFKSRVRGICPTEGTVPFPKIMVERCNAPFSSEFAALWGWDIGRAMDDTVGIPLDAYCYITKDVQRWSLVPWPQQVRQMAGLMKDDQRGLKIPGVMDSTGVGDPVLQFAQELGVLMSGFVFNDRSRQELLERLQGALLGITLRGPFAEGGELAWITEQLALFEYVYTPHGVRWKVPDNMHDDGAFGLALAVYAYDHIRPTVPAQPVPQHEDKRDVQRWEDHVGVGMNGEEPPTEGWSTQFGRGW